MKTECTAGQLEFHGLGRRVVVGQFDGGKISSDSGGLSAFCAQTVAIFLFYAIIFLAQDFNCITPPQVI